MHVAKDYNAICKIGGMLVSWGFCNKVRHPEGLKQQKLIVSQFGRIKVPDQGISRLVLSGGGGGVVREGSVASISSGFCSMLAICSVPCLVEASP